MPEWSHPCGEMSVTRIISTALLMAFSSGMGLLTLSLLYSTASSSGTCTHGTPLQRHTSGSFVMTLCDNTSWSGLCRGPYACWAIPSLSLMCTAGPERLGKMCNHASPFHSYHMAAIAWRPLHPRHGAINDSKHARAHRLMRNVFWQLNVHSSCKEPQLFNAPEQSFRVHGIVTSDLLSLYWIHIEKQWPDTVTE